MGQTVVIPWPDSNTRPVVYPYEKRVVEEEFIKLTD